jgi:stage V sporulation protein G
MEYSCFFCGKSHILMNAPLQALVYAVSLKVRRLQVDITEVRITLRNEEKLKAFASITFDDCFVVRGLKVINGSQGYFVSMPSRKRKDGSYQDVAHPINNDMRKKIEDKVLDAFENELNKAGTAPVAAKATVPAEEEEDFDVEEEAGKPGQA